MISEFLKKVLQENSKMEEELINYDLSNNINTILSKIKNSEELDEKEITIFKNIALNDVELTDIEKETLDFIVFLISINESLDTFQLDLINKLLDKYKIKDTSIIKNNLEKNNILIDSLNSKELFVYYDYLLETLNKYNYSNKEILIILKGLIKSNYKDYDKTNIKYIEKTDTIEEPKVEVLDKKVIDKLKRILKKYQINPNIFDETLFKYLPIEDNMFKNCEYILNFLQENGIDIKEIYLDGPLDLLFTLAFASKENVINVKEICTKNNIDITRLLRHGIIILNNHRTVEIDGTTEFFGLYENFLLNVDLLNSIGYKHSDNISIYIYYMDNQLCINCYDLLKNEYNISLKSPQELEMVFNHYFCNCEDRALELPNGKQLLLENFGLFLKEVGNKDYYKIKSKVYDLEKDKLLLSMNLNEIDKKYYKLFNLFYDSKGDIYRSVPLDYIVDHSLEENDYIKYLDSTVRKEEYIYLLNNTTRISRIKVLRVLNFLNKNGYEIGEDEVKFALKFDFLGSDEDILNIENAFKELKQGKNKNLY